MKEEHQKGPKEIIQVKPNTAKSTTQTTTEVETEEIANAGPSKKRANKVIKEKQSTEKKEGWFYIKSLFEFLNIFTPKGLRKQVSEEFYRFNC